MIQRCYKAAALLSLAGIMQAGAAGLENQWAFSAGGYSSFVIGPDSYMRAWGSNNHGQLGLGDNSNRFSPGTLYTQALNRSVDVSNTHGIAIQDGYYYAWGANESGELGDGTTNDSYIPVGPSSGGDWVSACAGDKHSVGLDVYGLVYTWGGNIYGQLGLGYTSSDAHTTPQHVPLPRIKSISCGDNYTMAVAGNGTLWAWGFNGSGNLGDNSTTTRSAPVQIVGVNNSVAGKWISVSAGSIHTVGIRDGGRAYAWGSDAYGQLGDGISGTSARSLVPKLITMPQSNRIVDISAGSLHTVAVTASGCLWAWGDNSSGELGDGTFTQRTTPVQIKTDLHNWLSAQAGNNHSLGMRVDGTLMSWGANDYGQLGRTVNGTFPANKPGPVLTSMRLGAITTGEFSSYLIKSDGTLWDWGTNGYGNLGITGTFNNTVPNKVAATSPASAANGWVKLPRKGTRGMMAIKAGGTLWAWGQEYNGELGNGGALNDRLTVPTQIGSDTSWRDVDCGGVHCVGLKGDGSLWSWGKTYHGVQSGITTLSTPTQVGTEKSWIAVGAGSSFTGAIKSDGTIWMWGSNTYGQLGQNDYTDRATPTEIVSQPFGWKDISCGLNHVLAGHMTGDVYAWGRNNYGQLGLQYYSSDVPSPAFIPFPGGYAKQYYANSMNSVAVDVRGDAYAWGNNSFGVIGNGTVGGSYNTPTWFGGARVAVVSYYATNAMALTNFLDTWGYNHYGQLGDGTTTDKAYPEYILTP